MTFTSPNLYSTQSIRQLEGIAIEEYNISAYELMCRAGRVSFEYIQTQYPLLKNLLVCCGAGNNAGDGYVVAKLAMQAGIKVSVVSLVDVNKLAGDALTAYNEWKSQGYQLATFSIDLLQQMDVVVDALIGTGLERDVQAEWRQIIEDINAQTKPVISIDIPSGIDADTGAVLGVAIKATTTITYVGLKKGLFTHQAVNHCGNIILDQLSLPESIFKHQSVDAMLFDWLELKPQIKPRQVNTHKHQCGHLLILGGDVGMPGALRLTAEAALRSGVGLVTVVSHAEHLAVLLNGRPEIMLHASETGHIPLALLNKVDAIIVGPGLSGSHWSQNLVAAALSSQLPTVIDAGALHLLDDAQIPNCVLTPHPGEASALLGESAAVVQASRFTSLEMLRQKYAAHIVLKGAGSLVLSPDELPWLCAYGNPGMATAGMGDVLSGIIGSLIAQGYELSLATKLGVCIHSLAADRAAEEGQTGLLSSDLFPQIRYFMNN